MQQANSGGATSSKRKVEINKYIKKWTQQKQQTWTHRLECEYQQFACERPTRRNVTVKHQQRRDSCSICVCLCVREERNRLKRIYWRRLNCASTLRKVGIGISYCNWLLQKRTLIRCCNCSTIFFGFIRTILLTWSHQMSSHQNKKHSQRQMIHIDTYL